MTGDPFDLDEYVTEISDRLGEEQYAKRLHLSPARMLFKKALERVQADAKARDFRDRKTRGPLRYRSDR